MSYTSGLLSVIIPAFNAERYLSKSIQSVLDQSYRPMEIIVVNDGSTDRTAEVAKTFDEVRLIDQENRGIGAARNEGLKVASGEWLCFQDADDVWTPRKLELQFSAMNQKPETSMIFGQAENFFSPELTAEERSKLAMIDKTLPARVATTLLIRRVDFDRVGLFDEELKMGEFLDWRAKAESLGLSEMVLPDLLLRRRVHLANTGRRVGGSKTDYFKVLRANIERARTAK